MNAGLQQFSDCFEQLQTRLPAAEQTQRKAQLQRFLSQGLPTRKLERWHYTDLSHLAEPQWKLAGVPETAPNLDAERIEGSDRLVFLNGLLATHLSDPGQIAGLQATPAAAADREAQALDNLNASFATAGVQLDLKKNQAMAQPLHLLSWQDGDALSMTHLRHSVNLAAGASAVLILESMGIAGLTTQHLRGQLGAGSELTIYRLQHEGEQATHLSQLRLELAEGARVKLVSVDVGGALVRHDSEIKLIGAEAQAEITGAYAIAGRSHLDNYVDAQHQGLNTVSRQLFRGVLDGHSKAALNSKVVVRPGAQKSDSEQSLRHLLLSAGPEVNAKPELEIYADDVKCAHGATVGQLDAAALHYLRTRGLDQQTARNLLTFTFVHQALSLISNDAVRERAEQLLHAKLPGAAMLETGA